MGARYCAERAGYAWEQPHWVQQGGHWVFVSGNWVRPRHDNGRGHAYGRQDRDRDGVPNRYDRDRDGDGVPNRFDRAPDNGHRR